MYDFVCRHFLACCSPDARGTQSRVGLDMGGERFSASGLIVLDPGFLAVYPFIRWSTHTLPVMAPGFSFVPTSLLLHEGSTAPPPLLAEHDLIRIMNENGIGTDATIPDHIQTVQDRKCVEAAGRGVVWGG